MSDDFHLKERAFMLLKLNFNKTAPTFKFLNFYLN